MLKQVQAPNLQACIMVTVALSRVLQGKIRTQSLLPMKIREGEVTGRWKWRTLTSDSILPTYIEHLLCARPIVGTGEKRKLRHSAVPGGAEEYTLRSQRRQPYRQTGVN